MPKVSAISCPVCGGPLKAGDSRCNYCGSLVVIAVDLPRINPDTLNRAVINEHISQFRANLKHDANDESAHYGLGVAYFNLGLLEEASEELRAAARLMPENPHIQTQLGVVLSRMAQRGNRESAEAALDRANRALLIDPYLVEALLLKANILEQLRQPDRALAVMQYAAKIAPDEINPRLVRAMLEQAQNDLKRGAPVAAIKSWRRAAEADESSVRGPLSAYLRENRRLLSSTRAWSKKPYQSPQKPPIGSPRRRDYGRGVRTAGLAVGSCLALLVVAIVSAVVTPEKNGEPELGTLSGITFIVSTLMVLLVPIAVILLRWKRGRSAQREGNGKTFDQNTTKRYREGLLLGTEDIDSMLNIATEVASIQEQRATLAALQRRNRKTR